MPQITHKTLTLFKSRIKILVVTIVDLSLKTMTEKTLKTNDYGKRWLVESYVSGLKRTTGATLAAKSDRSLFIEAALKVLAYAPRRY